MEKVSAVYKIVNTSTGDCYVGSSVDVKRRWKEHKKPSVWKRHPNSPMYLDMQKYGVDKFKFQTLGSIMPECLKQAEQDIIELLQPTYNSMYAKGPDVERQKEYQKEYRKEYQNQLCFYNGETLTLNALAQRFQRAGIKHATLEAKKYLLPSF